MSSLDQLMRKINKKYNGDIIKRGSELPEIDRIPFSSPRINWLTYGGIPIGRLTEICGPEGGGKTTTSLDLIKQAKIKMPDKEIAFLDLENTLDKDWAKTQGVDVDEIVFLTPHDQTAEEVLQITLDLIATGEFSLIVLDSIPYLVPQLIYEKELEKKSYGGSASVITDFCVRSGPLLSKHNTSLILINQMRDDLSNPYNIYHTPGGRALKHSASMRIYVRKGKLLDELNNELRNNAEDPHGNLVETRILKTKVSKPDRKVSSYTLNYTNGIDVLSDTIDMAIHYNVIIQAGAWYRIINSETGEVLFDGEEELKFQGKAKLLDFLRNNEEIFNNIKNELNEKAKN